MFDRKKYQVQYRRKHRKYFSRKHKEWRLRNKVQFAANQKMGDFKRYWMIEPQPCAVCNSKETECHHPNYVFPLCVVWLCKVCHGMVTSKLLGFADISHGIVDYGSLKRLGKLNKLT